MQAPDFWRHKGGVSTFLAPLGLGYELGGKIRRFLTNTERVGVPVFCVGNLVAGGAGKTPLAIALYQYLQQQGLKEIHFLSRGYGGSANGPLLVDAKRHSSIEVGDEPLLLARVAPTWISRDRALGARAIVAAGAKAIILDDGFQNPGLFKDFSFLVFDGGYGIGNGRVMPAGPMRESLKDGLKRAQAAVMIGEDMTGLLPRLSGLPVLKASLIPGPEAQELKGQRLFAFAGIGRPEKFFKTLEEVEGELVAIKSFSDHHHYEDAEIMAILSQAEKLKAMPITTEKDAVRLSPSLRARVKTLSVRLVLKDIAVLDGLLK
jgi:tetraacyldisaccharide 4'-kinase